ncbi:3'-5' exonuclease [Streptomyces sp. CA-132043]|uniref:3'-5' exonuclease n=1 Tax=Streptomyces sp. CA-132043 TaxID=3240048 RepID=UPI003D93EE88
MNWPACGQAKNLLLQDLAQGEEVIGKILLTTYHASKGREFDTVILPGLLNGITPRDVPERGKWRRPTAKELAEQRRAFYVALTRAETTLHLIIGPGYHTKNGYWIGKGPSDFVVEMARRPAAGELRGVASVRPSRCGPSSATAFRPIPHRAR